MRRIDLLRRRYPLRWMTAHVAALFVLFSVMSPDLKRDADMIVTAALTIAFGWALVLMIRHTRIWTYRGLGLLGTVTGDTALYIALGFGAALGIRGDLLDLARALLTVGVVHLLIGLTITDQENVDEEIVENLESPYPEPNETI